MEKERERKKKREKEKKEKDGLVYWKVFRDEAD